MDVHVILKFFGIDESFCAYIANKVKGPVYFFHVVIVGPDWHAQSTFFTGDKRVR